MEILKYKLAIFIVLAIIIQEIYSTKESENVEHTTEQRHLILDPLADLPLNENEIGDVSRNGDHTKDTLSRVKRQYYPYYRRRWPIPILFGGWFGGRGFGGRGFGGRGFGGRGFGGRGFGGGRGVGGGFGGGRGGGGGRG